MYLSFIDSIPVDILNSLEFGIFGVSGIFWCIVYIVAAYRGFKDKVVAMPLFALTLNFGWEFTMGFIYTEQLMPVVVWVCRAWCLFDCVLLIQEYLYGYKDIDMFVPGASRTKHIVIATVGLIGGFAFTYLAVAAWGDYQNGMYSAAIMNVSMSFLYILMLNSRKSSLGQSMWIAFFKWAGTDVLGLAVWGFLTRDYSMLGVNPDSLILFMGIVCFVLDFMYMVMLYGQMKSEGLNPWTRKPMKESKLA